MGQRKPYNPNTRYGRKKLREQAYHNYHNGTPEYRQDIDNIGCVVWSIFIVLAVIVFIIIANTKGINAAIKWLR